LFVSAGIDTRRMARALGLILREMKRLRDRPPTAPEVRRAKDYVIGQLRLGLESTASQMNWLGEHLLAYGKVAKPAVIEQRLEDVTGAAIQSVAADLFHDRHLNAAIISPLRQGDDLQAQLTWET
jgi:predicted Zn-dependent peptidase